MQIKQVTRKHAVGEIAFWWKLGAIPDCTQNWLWLRVPATSLCSPVLAGISQNPQCLITYDAHLPSLARLISGVSLELWGKRLHALSTAVNKTIALYMQSTNVRVTNFPMLQTMHAHRHHMWSQLTTSCTVQPAGPWINCTCSRFMVVLIAIVYDFQSFVFHKSECHTNSVPVYVVTQQPCMHHWNFIHIYRQMNFIYIYKQRPHGIIAAISLK